MVYKLEHYQKLAEKMIRADEERDLANDKYDKMDHVEWVPDKKLQDLWWFRSTPSTDPHDAISAGNRVLSALEEKLKLQPLASNPETKATANNSENVLNWVMKLVNRRRQGSVRQSVVRSSLKYDEVVAQVVDLDYQIKNREALGADTKREKAARRYGRFVVNTYHPNEVHVRYSNLMPEAVILVKVRNAQEVIDEYGEAAMGLLDQAEEDSEVVLYDYMDYEDHVIWAEAKQGGNEVEIMRASHDLPFLPWVARVGGDIMEKDAKHRRRPLLYSIMQSRAWQTQNIVRSLRVSEVIAYSSSPRYKEEGPMSEHTTTVDAGDVGMVADVTPGNVLTPIPPPGMDPGMREVEDMLQGQISKSTVAAILQGADVPSGTAFATLNLATQTAVGALKPAKELAEFAMADIYTLFLLWAHYTKNDIDGYGTEKANMGEQYSIAWDEIDPQNIYLSVELKPDVPLDRQQRANTAMMLLQRPGFYSKERALEDMGVSDPDQVIKEAYFEQLLDAQIANMIQMQAQQAAMQLQQQQMMQQQALASIQQQAAGAPGGNGYNPEMGGLPPQMAAPGATREGVTGEAIGGMPTETGLGGLG